MLGGVDLSGNSRIHFELMYWLMNSSRWLTWSNCLTIIFIRWCWLWQAGLWITFIHAMHYCWKCWVGCYRLSSHSAPFVITLVTFLSSLLSSCCHHPRLLSVIINRCQSPKSERFTGFICSFRHAHNVMWKLLAVQVFFLKFRFVPRWLHLLLFLCYFVCPGSNIESNQPLSAD